MLGPQIYHSPSAIRGGAGSVVVDPSNGQVMLTSATNIHEMRNGTNAQVLRVYNTTNITTTNYEYGSLGWVGNQFVITNAAGGTGNAARSIVVKTVGAAELFLGVDNGGYWKIAPTTRYFGPVVTNSVDLGATTNRIKSAYLSSALNIVSPAVVASAPVLDLSQEWDNAAVTFTAMKLNVTNTASAAASLLLDLQVASASVLSVRKSGTLLITGDSSTGELRWFLPSGNIHGLEIYNPTDTTASLRLRSNDRNVDIRTSQSVGPNSSGWEVQSENGKVRFYNSNATRIFGDLFADVNGLGISTNAFATGVTTFTITHGADTAVVAEKPTLVLTAHTMTITGSFARFADTILNQMTLSAATALTVTDAATLYVAGAPIAAGSAVLTRTYQAWFAGTGNLRIDTTTLTTVGGAGAASALPATPEKYLPVYLGTTVYHIPAYIAA